MILRESWLDSVERHEVCEGLVHFNLTRWSNLRDLPLKSGGFTDVYANLRDARNNPAAIDFITRYYEQALRRLRVDRFAEVPDAVSCFAGPLSQALGRPYVTIRENPKAGRVAKATCIGAFRTGERAAIFDDVITDGASKVAPYHECASQGVSPTLVVLVDRQQGWQVKFAELGINMPVWSGMTLHQLRRFLIESGRMQRCDPAFEQQNPLIIALDGKSWEEILPIADRLRTTGCILKVNDLLFYEGIVHLIPDLNVYGRVMADLKGHDIPNTVANTCKRLRNCPPWAVTVHASGGGEMVAAAVKALEGTPTKVLAVTVLTSLREGCEDVYTRQPLDQVRVLAALAHKAGAHGLVCSPEEVGDLRRTYPRGTLTLVTPGVRSPGEDAGDQKRVGTPAAAIEAGADHVVGGRQFLDAVDPVAEVKRVLASELGVSLR